MQAVRVILSTIIGGVWGAVGGGLLMYSTEWWVLPETKQVFALFTAVLGVLAGLVLGAIVGLAVGLTNSDATSAGAFGAGVGAFVAAIHLEHMGNQYVSFYVDPVYILRGVMIVVILAAIGSNLSGVVKRVTLRMRR